MKKWKCAKHKISFAIRKSKQEMSDFFVTSEYQNGLAREERAEGGVYKFYNYNSEDTMKILKILRMKDILQICKSTRRTRTRILFGSSPPPPNKIPTHTIQK